MDPEKIVAEMKEAIEGIKASQTECHAELKKATTESGQAAKDALAKADAAAEKIQGFSARLLEMEQKLAEGVQKGKASIQTLGQMVIAADGFKDYAAKRGKGSFATTLDSFQANTITGQEGSPAVNSDTLVAPYRLPGIIAGAQRALKIRDLLPSGTLTGNSLQLVQELLFTNNAAETAEGADKPESDIEFLLKTFNVATIAHWIKVSKQILEDSAALASYIDARMRYGVEYRYDQQLLKGDGVGQNISGITDTGNYTAFTPETGFTLLDNINLAIEKVRLADYEATGIVLNPADWGNIERLKDSQQRYIVGNPLSPITPTLWGKPVVVTNAMTAGKILVGAFDMSHMVFNRQGVTVDFFEQDDKNVQQNLITVRAEARGLLATLRPASVQYGDGTV